MTSVTYWRPAVDLGSLSLEGWHLEHPSSQRDHCHTASWLAWELKEKAHSGHHLWNKVVGLKSNYLCWRRQTWESYTCTFLCSLINEPWKNHPLTIHVLITWLVSQIPSPYASLLTMSPCSCGGFQRKGWNKYRFWPGYVQAYTVKWRRSRNKFSALRPRGNGLGFCFNWVVSMLCNCGQTWYLWP